MLGAVTRHKGLEPRGVAAQQRRRVAVEGVRGVGVLEEVRQLGLHDIQDRHRGAPRLVERVQADAAAHLVNVGVKDALLEPHARRLERELLADCKHKVVLVAFVRRVLGRAHRDAKVLQVRDLPALVVRDLESRVIELPNVADHAGLPHPRRVLLLRDARVTRQKRTRRPPPCAPRTRDQATAAAARASPCLANTRRQNT